MYTNQNNHRFPALVLAAGLTTAVLIGLSALAQSGFTTALDSRQLAATTRSAPQAAVASPLVAPLRVTVVATRS
jgi:hypothetical protein